MGLDAGRRVDWVAAIDPNNSIQDALGSTIEVTEPSVHSLRPLRLRGQPHPFVEVIGTTHMGHGNLYLYEFLVDRRELRLKLCTFVLDRHADDSLISGGGVLARAYRDVNDDGYADVEIHATATFRSNPEAAGAEEVSLRRVFLWSTETECFEEDRSARKGFERVYPGRS
ncbi:MAG: hypothetical protein D6731_15820 [Planctomycetota bacterium]|nr:MAG: hypothetical protein D6731_15820 [Planctomycetota bacterium]